MDWKGLYQKPTPFILKSKMSERRQASGLPEGQPGGKDLKDSQHFALTTWLRWGW